MTLDFEKFAMKGNEFLHKLEANLEIADRGHAARILRSTFKVLRNHLTLEESFQLLSQLPMAIKSVYVEGWKLSDHKKIKTDSDFLIEVIEADGNFAGYDFTNKQELIEAVQAVIDTTKLYVSEEEVSQALGTLPKKIQVLIESSYIQ